MDSGLCSIVAAGKHMEGVVPWPGATGRLAGGPDGGGGGRLLHRSASGSGASGHWFSPVSAATGGWNLGGLSNLGRSDLRLGNCFPKDR